MHFDFTYTKNFVLSTKQGDIDVSSLYWCTAINCLSIFAVITMWTYATLRIWWETVWIVTDGDQKIVQSLTAATTVQSVVESHLKW